MKTMVKVLLIGLVVVVALVAFLLLNDFDSPGLGQTLLAKINAATGVNITAKSYRLNLLHGLVLEGVEATSETPSRRTHLLLDRMVFEHRLAPLFSGTVAIDKVLFERPQIEIVESAATEAGQAPAESKPAPSPPRIVGCSGSDIESIPRGEPAAVAGAARVLHPGRPDHAHPTGEERRREARGAAR